MSREGPLGDEKKSKEARDARKRALRVYDEDLRALVTQAAFVRWFGRLCKRAGLWDSVWTANGSELNMMAGQRHLAAALLTEIEQVDRPFLERVLGARRSLEAELNTMDLPDEGEDEEEDA